jgi:CubicO group peptidase (beta-lactamase class C family)
MSAAPEAPLGKAFALLDDFVAEGLFPGAVLHVTHRGKLAGVHAVGLARRDPPLKVDPLTIFPLFSMTKPLVSTLVLGAVDDGKLALEDPVARFLPGFEVHGKGGIRVRHLLTHSAGIPVAPGPDLLHFESNASFVAPLYHVVPDHPPATRAVYHGQTAFALLGAVFERASGIPLAQGLRERVFEPLEMRSSFLPLPPECEPRVASVYAHPSDHEDERWAEAVNRRSFRAAGHPAGGAYSTAEDLGRFLRCWLGEGALGVRRLLRSETAREALRIQFPGVREGVPLWPGVPPALRAVDLGPTTWGLGWRLRGEPPEPLFGFGAASSRAFGHAGLSCVLCWADPERQLTFVLLTNGTLPMTPVLRVRTRLSRAVVEAFP